MGTIKEDYVILGAVFVLMPLFVFAPFYAALPVVLTLGLLLSPLGIVKAILCLGFFNMASMDNSPFWGGMSGCFLLMMFLVFKQPLCFRLFLGSRLFFVFIAALSILALNFLILGLGALHEKTALKSIVQQVIFIFGLCFFAFYMCRDSERVELFLKSRFPVFLAVYVAFFGLCFAIFGDGGRFGAGLGAQALAMNASLLFAYYVFDGSKKLALSMFLIVVMTGSRTYIAIDVLVVLLYVLHVYKDFSSRVFVSVGTKIINLVRKSGG